MAERILITGGAGFIGCHVAEALLARGNEVRVGKQTRSFCYVDDLVERLLRLLDHPGLLEGPVNLGNPSEISILDPVGEVVRLTGSRSRVVRLPLPEGDPHRRCPDITLARRLLGWRPPWSSPTGCARRSPSSPPRAARSFAGPR